MEERGCAERSVVVWKRKATHVKVVVHKEMVALEEVTVQKGEVEQVEELVASFR